MTVIADNKKRVTLPTKPGERFDVQAFGDDKFVLTRLVPTQLRLAKVTFKNVDGYSVADTDREIDMAAVNKALEKFP